MQCNNSYFKKRFLFSHVTRFSQNMEKAKEESVMLFTMQWYFLIERKCRIAKKKKKKKKSIFRKILPHCKQYYHFGFLLQCFATGNHILRCSLRRQTIIPNTLFQYFPNIILFFFLCTWQVKYYICCYILNFSSFFCLLLPLKTWF